MTRARPVNAAGVTVWVVGYEDLARMKEASGHEQDLLEHSSMTAKAAEKILTKSRLGDLNSITRS
jgi:hypothetical protein